MRNVLVMGLAALALAGCGIPEGRRLSAMSPDELQTVSNRSLCNFYADSRAVDRERARRQVQCTNSADNPATWYLLDRATQPQPAAPAPGSQVMTCRRSVGNTTQCIQ